MMLPTHALAGMVLGLSVAVYAPEFAPVAIVAGLVGGAFPDADMYIGHRKSLHFPVYYSLLAPVALVIAAGVPSTATVFAAVFLAGAAVHSVSDIFGGGLELRPWEATSDRAVYDHYHKEWLSPRRWVGYDGAPRDLLVSITLAVPLLITLEGSLRLVVIAALAVAAGYTVLRRRLATLAAVLVENLLAPRLPDPVMTRVPARYRDTVR